METILCAAIWYDDGVERVHLPKNIKTGIVFCGHRHHNCFATVASVLYPNWQNDTMEDFLRKEVLENETQGFLTSENRFLNRKEAAKIAIEAKQIEKLNYGKQLYSEDLY